MNYRLAVRNLQKNQIEALSGLFLYCVGYETRSRFLAENIDWPANNTIAVRYTDTRVHSFVENESFAVSKSFGIVDDDIRLVEQKIITELSLLRSREGQAAISVDVSAMDRTLMAQVLLTSLASLEINETLNVLYSPAKYQDPTRNLVPIRRIGAVHPHLAAEIASPDSAKVVLMGVGYEYGVAINILETHEPDISFIFRPNGTDERFKQAVSSANYGFDFGERNYEVIDYFLDDIAGAYDDISNVVVSTKHDSSIVCVPMGPKILSAIMIIAGLVHQPKVSVLRYSIATLEPQDSVPEGGFVGISVKKLR